MATYPPACRRTFATALAAAVGLVLSGCGSHSASPAPKPTSAAIGVDTSSSLTTATATATPPSDLWERLAKQDGLVLLLRHATSPGSGDPAGFRLGDCSTQRNLSDDGRKEAQAIGASLRAHRIPISTVLSSQWCRSIDTARLLDVGAVQEAAPLNYLSSDKAQATAQTAATRTLIAEAATRRGVTVMVTHSQNIAALFERSPAMGAALVIAPSTGADLKVIATIDDW